MCVEIDSRCYQPNTINVVLISGGKDSTAVGLLAKNANVERLNVFADTGHEHSITYEYVKYLSEILGEIHQVRADLSKDIERKRQYITDHWQDNLISRYGFSKERATAAVKRALDILHPTGNPFLDLCMLKGRFPSTKARFCSTILKHDAVKHQIIDRLLDRYEEVIIWQGVRAQESPARANLPVWETDADNTPGLHVYRPILNWSHDQVFSFAKQNGVKPNPLYLQGFSRVGCMPCIHARKSELREIFLRYPYEVARVEAWERLVSLCSPRGCSTFFISTIDPCNSEKNNSNVSTESHGIRTVKNWALTTRGGRQFDLLAGINESATCNSVYAGICE
ncbi:hypothetical protein B6D23_01600 [Gilliamella sp. N-W3]|uniref:phosphoadenosine phosphosulfate reductase domain-containing protein n=1 Tax=Gilliamella sp. N-W3 TaxID=1970474 RepID=UPI000A33EF63|nr:phosphoadenosine phosphosulfate reductase family protein [Gilliamella sp. N-W3]OTQ80491.1 hypothetical protein B6D23_01600 [Gilliamella sp. N-W3]